jgi:alpha-tubulin suppressor-like RCC1 family protein
MPGFLVNSDTLENELVQWSELGLDNTSGYLWATGGNGPLGVLGNNSALLRSSPVQIGSLTDWISVAENSNVVALRKDGTLWTWGSNFNGASGQNTTTPSSTSSPAQVGSLTNWAKVSGGQYGVRAIKKDGTLWVWGDNVSGGLGDSTIIPKSSPIQIGSLTDWAFVVASNSQSTAAIKTNGTLWTWGSSFYGNLGNSSILSRSSPVQVGALTDWKILSCSSTNVSSVKVSGTLWTWGLNTNGQLGDGTIIHRSSPVQVGSLTDWKYPINMSVSSGCLKTDGTLWTWGYNHNGQLGSSTVIHRSSPVQVGALTNWSSITNQDYGIAAVKTDGTLWTWGHNFQGRLGQGDLVHRSSPTQVGALTTWKKVLGAGSFTSYALSY